MTTMVKPLSWSVDPSAPLVEQLSFVEQGANSIVLGTGQFRAGQTMPLEGYSQYPMREISIILEGRIETECDGETFILSAGDVVTIGADQRQRSTFTADTKLIYLFFGNTDPDGLAT